MLGAIGCGLVVGWLSPSYMVSAARWAPTGWGLGMAITGVGALAGATWFFESWPGMAAALLACALGAGLRMVWIAGLRLRAGGER